MNDNLSVCQKCHSRTIVDGTPTCGVDGRSAEHHVRVGVCPKSKFPPATPSDVLPWAITPLVISRREVCYGCNRRERRTCTVDSLPYVEHASRGDCPLMLFPGQIAKPVADRPPSSIPPQKSTAPVIDSPAIEVAAVRRIGLIRGPACVGCSQNNGLTSLTIACSCRTCQAKKIATWTCPTGRWQKRELKWLREFFDRVVVISLERTPERLQQFQHHIAAMPWPLKDVTVFAAVDGTTAHVPEWWSEGGPAWGCLQSHRQVLADAKRDGINRLLVMEDDARFPDDATDRLFHFLARAPEDWDCLMIGGQQMGDGRQTPALDGVKLVTQCERTHCYALSREGIYGLSKWWSESVSGHCDWQLGDWQESRGVRTYRPDPMISFQGRNFSTITYKQTPARSWSNGLKVHNRNESLMPIVYLESPREIAESLVKTEQIHIGYNRNSKGIDRSLVDLTKISRSDRQRKIRQYFVEWNIPEAAAFPNAVACLWHPGLALEDVMLSMPDRKIDHVQEGELNAAASAIAALARNDHAAH